MKKRILSLILIIAICIPMFGIFAYAEAEENDGGRVYPNGKGQYMEAPDSSDTPDRLLPGQSLKISTITVTGVKEPVHGATPDTNFTVAENGLTQKPNASGWLDVEAGRWMTSSDTFQVDKMYEFRAFVIPKSGYTFSDSNITASMNGYATKVMLGAEEGTRCVSYQFKCTGSSVGTLKEAYLYVDAPKVGEKPDEYSGTSTYDYVGDNVSWSPNDGVFKAGVAYTCTTFASIDYFEGIFDENITVYINDKEAEIVERSKEFLKVKYTFPALIKPEYKFPFTDVPDSAWFRGDVEIAHKNGLINGKTETLYCPNHFMTYAEAIKLAATMNQLYYEGKVTLKNGDEQWYSTYMAYALEKGIIAQDMSLQANQSITRRDFVKIFRASMPSSGFPVINEVSDGKIPDVAMNSDGAAQIYDFYRAGILIGSDALGTFNPDSNIVRSEVAAILTRMFDDTARKAITLK